MTNESGRSGRAIGWGFLGTGSISHTVASEISEYGGGNLVAAYGFNEEKGAAFVEKFGFSKFYPSLEGLLRDPQVDAIYVALPHSLHIDCILAGLDAGKHVLCEKPLAMSAGDVARIKAHPRAADLVIAEGFMLRHHPQWLWIRGKIAEGAIGQVRAVQAHSCLTLDFPDQPPALPGRHSMLLDIGCYSIHLARMLFDAEPLAVTARLHHQATSGVDTGMFAELSFDAGVAQLVVSGTLFPSRRIHVFGTEGAIEICNPVHPSPGGTSKVILHSSSGPVEKVFARAPQYALQFLEFSKAVEEGRSPMVSIDDAWGNAKIIDAIRASSEMGGERIALD